MAGGSMGRFSSLVFASAIFGATLTAGEIGPKGRVTVIRTLNGGSPAEASVGTDGTIHLIYNSREDLIPYYVKSSDHGATFSSPVAVVEKASRKPGLEFATSSMAVGNGGTIYVAMMTNNWKTKLAGVPEGLVFTTLQPGAKAFLPVRSLNGRPSEGFSLAA